MGKTEKLKQAYYKYNMDFYFSVFASFSMGTIHLISVILAFDWIVLNYCVFSYLMMLFKVWQWAIEKYNIKPSHYIAGAVSVGVVLAPMMISFVATIYLKGAPTYIFDWFIFAYALYGTVKMTMAIIKLSKKNVEKTDRECVNAWLGLLSAFYTMQMMEFKLIMFASDGVVDKSMFYLQMISQATIFCFAVFLIVLFIRYDMKSSKQTALD